MNKWIKIIFLSIFAIILMIITLIFTIPQPNFVLKPSGYCEMQEGSLYNFIFDDHKKQDIERDDNLYEFFHSEINENNRCTGYDHITREILGDIPNTDKVSKRYNVCLTNRKKFYNFDVEICSLNSKSIRGKSVTSVINDFLIRINKNLLSKRDVLISRMTPNMDWKNRNGDIYNDSKKYFLEMEDQEFSEMLLEAVNKFSIDLVDEKFLNAYSSEKKIENEYIRKLNFKDLMSHLKKKYIKSPNNPGFVFFLYQDCILCGRTVYTKKFDYRIKY